MAVAVAVAVAVGAVVLALFTAGAFVWWDRLGFLVAAAPVVWFLHRQATVAAVPSPAGLHVRNLVVRRDLAWPEVVSVRFGGGRPWVQLDLADGDVLPVMGVQAADGPAAEAEASRLATLVELHSRPDRGR